MTLLQHTESLGGLLSLLLKVVVPVSQLVVHLLLSKVFLGEVVDLRLQCLVLILHLLPFGLFLLEVHLVALSRVVELVAVLVELRQLLLELWYGLLSQLLIKAIKVRIPSNDLINKLGVGLNVVSSSILNSLLQLFITLVQSLLLGLTLIDQVLQVLYFFLELLEFALVLHVELVHLRLGLFPDVGSLVQRSLGVGMVLSEIDLHVVKLVKIPEGSFLIVHDDLLILLNALDNIVRLRLQVLVHSLDVISLSL